MTVQGLPGPTDSEMLLNTQIRPQKAHSNPYWIRSIGLILAVGIAYILRGRGGDASAIAAAQGRLDEILREQRAHHTKNHPERETGGSSS